MTDEQFYEHLREVDNSGQDIDALLEKSLVKSESLEKIARITKEIQRLSQQSKIWNRMWNWC